MSWREDCSVFQLLLPYQKEKTLINLKKKHFFPGGHVKCEDSLQMPWYVGVM